MTRLINQRWFLYIILTTCALWSACKKEETRSSSKAPLITRVRAISPAPNDSTLSMVMPGQLVVIQGQNFLGVQSVFFNGVLATFNSAFVADENIVVQVPEPDFSSPATGQESVLRLVTNAGETTFTIPLLPPAPVVSGVSNDYVQPGGVLTIYGQFLYMVNEIAFTGGNGTNIITNKSGTSLQVTVPPTATTGNIILTTKGGKSTYVGYNDRVTGMFSNFDDVNPFQYWSASQTDDAGLFPGNSGGYVRMNFTDVGINDNAWYNGGRSINMNEGQWVPQANLADAPANWALKFQIYVKEPWKTGALLIRTNEYNYMARYEPWKTAAGGTFTSTGWITVTLPLSQFKKAAAGFEGSGEPLPDLPALLGTSGKQGMSFMFYNDSTTPIAKFDAAVDDIRIVKIR